MDNKAAFWLTSTFPGPTIDLNAPVFDGIAMPSGTEATRPSSPEPGTIRFNTTTQTVEVSIFGGAWVTLGIDSGGNGVDTVFGRTGNVIPVAGDYSAVDITVTPAGNLTSITVQDALTELQTDIDNFTVPPQTAAEVPVTPVGNLTSTDAQAALSELQTDIDAIVIPAPQTAAEVTSVASGNLVATNVQAALDEIQTEIDSLPGTPVANEITVTPTGNLGSLNVQDALEELQSDIDGAAGGGAKQVFWGFLTLTVNAATGSPNPVTPAFDPFDTIYNAIAYVNETYEFLEFLSIELAAGSYTFNSDIEVPPSVGGFQIYSDGFDPANVDVTFGSNDTIEVLPWQQLQLDGLTINDLWDTVIYGGSMSDCVVNIRGNRDIIVRPGTRTGFGSGLFTIFGCTFNWDGGIGGDYIFRLQGGGLIFDNDNFINVTGIDGADPAQAFMVTEEGGSILITSGSSLTLSDFEFANTGEIIIRNAGSFVNNGTLNGRTRLERSALTTSTPRQTISGTAYTATRNDAQKYNETDDASPVTITIDGTTGFEDGDELYFEQGGAGAITFAPAGGMTINSRGGSLETAGQYATVFLKFKSATEATLNGDLV